MSSMSLSAEWIGFGDLETRFGKENAISILRTLEQFEGVIEARVAKLPLEDRLRNVFYLMKDSVRFQTQH